MNTVKCLYVSNKLVRSNIVKISILSHQKSAWLLAKVSSFAVVSPLFNYFSYSFCFPLHNFLNFPVDLFYNIKLNMKGSVETCSEQVYNGRQLLNWERFRDASKQNPRWTSSLLTLVKIFKISTHDFPNCIYNITCYFSWNHFAKNWIEFGGYKYNFPH